MKFCRFSIETERDVDHRGQEAKPPKSANFLYGGFKQEIVSKIAFSSQSAERFFPGSLGTNWRIRLCRLASLTVSGVCGGHKSQEVKFSGFRARPDSLLDVVGFNKSNSCGSWRTAVRGREWGWGYDHVRRVHSVTSATGPRLCLCFAL